MATENRSITRQTEVTAHLNLLLVLMLTGGGVLSIMLAVFVLQSRGLLLPMYGLVGACLGAFVVVRPALGVVATVATAMVFRVQIGTGTDSPIVASLVCATLLLAGWSISGILHGRPLLTLPRIVSAPAMLLAFATIFSLLWGRLTLDPRIVVPPVYYRVQLAQAGLVIIGVGLLFVGADLFRDSAARRMLTLAVIGLGIVALPLRWFGITPQVLNTEGLFGLWFISLTWANALVNRRLPDWLRIALGSLALGWLAMALVREGSWVSGWLPAVISILIITNLARPRFGLATMIVTITGITLYYSVVHQLLIEDQRAEGSIGGDFGRLALVQRNLEFLGDRLIFGTGPAGYALYYVAFLPREAMSTHNNYVDMIAQFGIAGLVGLIGLLIGLFLHGWRYVKLVADPVDQSFIFAVIGAIPALGASLFLGDWLIPFVYNQTIAGFDHAVYSWLMMAGLCGLCRQVQQATSDA